MFDNREQGRVTAGQLEPSDRYGWQAVARNLLPFGLTLWLTPHVADMSFLSALLLSPVLGVLCYRLTIVMHDCAHHTLFRQRQVNEWVGKVAGALTGIDFRSFSELHWEHHRRYGRSGDPQGFHYLGLPQATPSAFLWHMVKPLCGLNARHVLPESVISPSNLWRMRPMEWLLLLVSQILVLGLVTGFGRHLLLLPLPFVSAVTFGLFCSQIRGISEHGVIASEISHVRSHASHWFDRIFLYDLNFNYHREHHEQPGIPSCHLPEFARRAIPAIHGESRSMLRTVFELYAHLRAAHV